MIVHFQASFRPRPHIYTIFYIKVTKNTKSHGNYLLPILLFARYFTHFRQAKTELVTSSSHDFHKTLQNRCADTQLYKTGVGAGQIVFLRPKIRSLFVERNAFFSELDFHVILPCVIFVVFYVIPNPPGLTDMGSGGESEARQHNENPRPKPLPGKTQHQKRGVLNRRGVGDILVRPPKNLENLRKT